MATHKTKPQCHIHDKVEDRDVDDIRSNVCAHDEALTKHADGKQYCLFHLPTKEKHIARFEEIFWARLDAVEKRISQIEKLSKEEQRETKRKLSYDFRYVWFPSDVEFDCKFAVAADFSLATFSADAYFSLATFSAGADFRSATFSADAYFSETTFSAGADFRSATFSAASHFNSAAFSTRASFIKATFSADAYFSKTTFSAAADFTSATFSAASHFNSATFAAAAHFNSATFAAAAHFDSAIFSADAYFRLAIFSADAYFRTATFSAGVYFRSAKFLEESQVFFRQARFCETVNFTYSVFAGHIAFEGQGDEYVFLDKKAVLNVKKELNEKFEILQKELAKRGISFEIPDNFEENQEAVLDLQNARLERPERISFHRVRLCPGWFVNIDPRKIIFTDVIWINLERIFRNTNITAEIENLKRRNIDEPTRLLEIACRQLGANAEENNRYEDASNFRYMAMETKRLEYRWHGRLWTLSWWYRLSSGYGENWSRALSVLLGILLLFALFYNSPFANFELGEVKQENTQNLDFSVQQTETPTGEKPKFQKMNNLEGFVHSLYVAALQRPEPKAADTTTRLFVILETIFAPLQAALLALAIRRKFMR